MVYNIGFGMRCGEKDTTEWGLQVNEVLEWNAWLSVDMCHLYQRVRVIGDQDQLLRQSSSPLKPSVPICQGLLMQSHVCLFISNHINNRKGNRYYNLIFTKLLVIHIKSFLIREHLQFKLALSL